MSETADSACVVNIHATAIVVGRTGILFTGPSGAGKSSLAFTCLAEAEKRGSFAALVSDDRVFVSCQSGRLIGRRPNSIAGLLELRGSGIVPLRSVAAAVLDIAVLPVAVQESERLPPEDERLDLGSAGHLPLLRVDRDAADPLARISALMAARDPSHPAPWSICGIF